MANMKTTPQNIIQNRVNGVVNSFGTFKRSLSTHCSHIENDDFTKIIEFLEKQCENDIIELKKIYNEGGKKFTL